MISIIENHKEEIQRICERHHVRQLFLFGSATNERFGETSDLDFQVYFDESVEVNDFADNFFGLMEELKNLLNREIDLVTDKSVKNPILKEEIEQTRVLLYAA